MRVEIRTRQGGSGEVFLRNGVAVGSDERTQRLLDETTIIEADSLERLTPDMGERFLRALPQALSGSYLAAVVVESE